MCDHALFSYTIAFPAAAIAASRLRPSPGAVVS